MAALLELMLLSIGIAFIYGAGVEVGGDLAQKWFHQLFWIVLGGILYVTIASIDYHTWCRHGFGLYSLGIFLLIYVLIFGKTINNSRGWLLIPGTHFFLQPSELVKPATLLFASWLATRPGLRHSHLGVWLPSFLVLATLMLPTLLICLQPDTGTAMVLLPLAAIIVFMSGMKWRYIFLAAALGLAMIPVLYFHAKPYQQARIKVFLSEPAQELSHAISRFIPENAAITFEKRVQEFLTTGANDRRNSKLDDWNAVQSLIAVGSAGFYGKGYLQGTQHVLGYLPRTVAPTDFIFAVIAEETGFLGSSSLIGIFCALILCFFRSALAAKDPLGSFLCMGVITIFSTHILINISMTIRAAPIVGLPLPFVSYGGSFMLGTMVLAGIVQSVHIHTNNSAISFYHEEFDDVDFLKER